MRRHVLLEMRQQAAQWLACLLLGLLLTVGVQARPAGEVQSAFSSRVGAALAASSLPACLKGIAGASVILPTTSSYNAKRKDFNLRTQSKPSALVYAASASQVQKAVRCVRQFKTRVVPRCGGHSFEGYSVQNGVVVVDLSRMNSVKVAAGGGTALIGGGATHNQVYRGLWSAGRYAFPGGTTGIVGFGGLILGGGFGFLTRKYGLASDNLLEVQAVLADGSLVTANSRTRADLFWACRGGGGGQYAIVTRFKVKIYRQPGGKASYAVQWRWPFSAVVAARAMDWYQTNVPTMPREFSGDLTIHGDGTDGGYVKIGGVFLGSKADAVKAFTDAGLYKALGQPKSNQGYQNSLNSTLGFTYNPPPLYFKSHSVMQLSKYRAAGLQAIARQLAAGRATLSPLSPDIDFEIQWHPLGGRVKDLAPGATAFPYRGALLNAKLRVAWQNPAHAAACLKWLKGITAAAAPYQSNTAYSNYADADLGARSGALYFGNNLARLKVIKKKYDATNLLRFPNSI